VGIGKASRGSADGACVAAVGLLTLVVVLSGLTTAGPIGPRSLPPPGVRGLGPALSGVAPRAPVTRPGHPRPNVAGENWYNLSSGFPPGVPGNRTFAALAYDPALNGTLMFGGYNHSANSSWGDTWLFANGTWANLSANLSSAPSARWAALMTWDPWNHEMVLFGGRDGLSILGDTWVFDSSGWTRLSPSVAPSGRQAQFSVFTADPTLRADYLYGGSYYLGGEIYNDSWTFVNGTWSNVTSAVTGGPSILDYGRWDPPSHAIVGYASTATNCSGTASTVSFNGTAWSVLNATSPPGPVTQGGGLVYDPADSAMVLFGGGYDTNGICAFRSNTWEYGNGTWTNRTAGLAAAPYARCCDSVAYDPTQKVVVLVGGAETSQAYIGDTWTFPAAPLALTLNRSASAVGVTVAVNFSASVTGGRAPLSLHWSFGDGSANASGANVSHAYSTPGNFTVNFSVRDSQGRAINRATTISVVAPLVAGVRATPTWGEAPLRVNFSASTAGGVGPYVYSWAFGDQQVGSGVSASHVYRTGGDFTATLTERDGARQLSQVSVNLSVAGPLGVVVSTTPASNVGDVPFLVNFTAAPSGNETPFTAIWTFGDGSAPATGLDVSHRYLSAGSFVAAVTVSDAAGHEANGTIRVLVDAPLAASASAVRTAGIAPLSVTFAASAFNGTAPFQFGWSFGDGSPNASGANPVHVYTQAGVYTAQLTTTDSGGDRVVSTVRIDVVNPLTASAQANVTLGVAPLSVAFTSNVAGGLLPERVSWTFGDGDSATSANVTHLYATGSSYTVALTVSDALGESVDRSLTVDVYSPLTASVSANPASLTVGQTTNLTAATTGGSGGATFAWAYLPPGCTSSNGPNEECTPTGAGTFNVTVSIRDSRNDPATASVQLTVDSATPTTSTSSGGVSTSELIGVAAGAGLIAAAVVVFVSRRRTPRRPEDGGPEPAPAGDGDERYGGSA
jgi:PKD repeat protein